MLNHELRVTYTDGGKRTYDYQSLELALLHAVECAHLDGLAEVSVWTISKHRVFTYVPAPTARTLQREEGGNNAIRLSPAIDETRRQPHRGDSTLPPEAVGT